MCFFLFLDLLQYKPWNIPTPFFFFFCCRTCLFNPDSALFFWSLFEIGQDLNWKFCCVDWTGSVPMRPCSFVLNSMETRGSKDPTEVTDQIRKPFDCWLTSRSHAILEDHCTWWPLSECRMVSSAVFFRVKMMTLPVWLNRGAPATRRRPCLADTTDVTV